MECKDLYTITPPAKMHTFANELKFNNYTTGVVTLRRVHCKIPPTLPNGDRLPRLFQLAGMMIYREINLKQVFSNV